MATRCQVLVKGEGSDKLLYHHWDGYPTRILETLLYAYRQKRGSKETMVESLKDVDDKFEPDRKLFYGVDWFYVLRPGKSGAWLAEVYHPKMEFMDSPRTANLELLETLDLSKESFDSIQEKAENLMDSVDWEEGIVRSAVVLSRMDPAPSRTKRKPGWHREPARHALAAKGVKTRRTRVK